MRCDGKVPIKIDLAATEETEPEDDIVTENVTADDDIEALLNQVGDTAEIEDIPEQNDDVSIDDIDAILNGLGEDSGEEDIDAILNEASTEIESAAQQVTTQDVASDDIDALLDEALSGTPLPDDIDALLDEVTGSEENEPEQTGEQFDTEEEQLAAIMANIGEDTESGEPDLKKDEAEPVAAAVDSANATQEKTIDEIQTDGVESEETQLAAIMADIENDQLSESNSQNEKLVDVSEITSEIDEVFESEEELFSAIVAEAEPVVESEPVAEAEPEVESEPGVEAEPEVEAESEVAAEPESEAEPEVAAEPETEVEVEAEPEAEAEPEVESELEVEAEHEVEAEPEVEAELDVATESVAEIEQPTLEELRQRLREKTARLEQNKVEPAPESSAEIEPETQAGSEEVLEVEQKRETKPTKVSSSDFDFLAFNQGPLPDDDALDELLMNVWHIESEAKDPPKHK